MDGPQINSADSGGRIYAVKDGLLNATTYDLAGLGRWAFLAATPLIAMHVMQFALGLHAQHWADIELAREPGLAEPTTLTLEVPREIALGAGHPARSFLRVTIELTNPSTVGDCVNRATVRVEPLPGGEALRIAAGESADLKLSKAGVDRLRVTLLDTAEECTLKLTVKDAVLHN